MEENAEPILDEEVMLAVEDSEEGDISDVETNGISSFVYDKYLSAKNARDGDEQRWLNAYRNYRGIYGPDVQFTDTEKSRIFVKVTKTKVTAAADQISDVLLGSSTFPITIDPTTLPEGVEESVHLETNQQISGMMDSFPELQPGETTAEFTDRLGSLSKELQPVAEKLKAGPGGTPTQVTFHPAEVSAKKMQKLIHDQLEESNASKHLKSVAFELPLFGTGIMKGPFAVEKEYPSWDEEGNYDPIIKTIPKVSQVSIWNFYPDPSASTSEECEFVIERHKMSRSNLRDLKNRPYFRDTEIDLCLAWGENYIKEDWEDTMDESKVEARTDRFEVLEFWGHVDTSTLKEYGFEVPQEVEDQDQLNVNIWVCHDRVIRMVMNPFTPSIIPYYAVPYEINPYSIFGIGVAENMEDTQILMNGFMRMAVDNAALSGNLLIEVDEDALVPGQDLKVYPGKVFRRQGGAPGQAIFGTKFPNVSTENMQMFDKARMLADESTGFPSFAHGQTGVSGVGRTASGISMLMSAANGSIRSVVKNVDDYLLAPLGKALFSFNMQFNFDKDIKGDLDVKAGGTESLMANEVRSQRLMQLLGIVQNPMLAPFAKLDYIIREIAKSLDLDPEKVTNSMGKAAIQAEFLSRMNPQQTQEEVPAGIQAGDNSGSGGGTMGIGTAPTPGEQGFSGNTGEGS